jgi:glucokinase
VKGVTGEEIIIADIGGTRARLALTQAGAAPRLDDIMTFDAVAHGSLESVFAAFAEQLRRPLPRAAVLAVAAPITPGVLRFTNSRWTIDPAAAKATLGLDRLRILNDFAAVAHAVHHADAQDFRHLCGPDVPLPDDGTISVIGPGTGLGIAQLVRRPGMYHAIATEGAHIGFAPVDAAEDALLARLRPRFGRVSIERLVSGPGLAELLPEGAARADDAALWAAAISGSDPAARAALDHWLALLGGFCSDAALMHWSGGIVLAGGLANRLADHLPRSGFHDRLVAKGRYREPMQRLPVKLLTLAEPGLFGAALAFTQMSR